MTSPALVVVSSRTVHRITPAAPVVRHQTGQSAQDRQTGCPKFLTPPFGGLMALVDADEAVPAKARQALTTLFNQCSALHESVGTFEAEIVAHARHDDTARRLATVPGIGPITASLIAATVADIGVFPSSRHFAAWLGLAPRQHSTGGKIRLGRITKTGNRETRRLLVRVPSRWFTALHSGTAPPESGPPESGPPESGRERSWNAALSGW